MSKANQPTTQKQTSWHSCKYLSERYDVPLRTVQDLCKQGKIACIKVGRSYRVSDEAIAAFENQQ